jgi:3D (Asp-Asp-Asp) domain-containing protein
LIGRALCTGFIIATLSVYPAIAAWTSPSPVTHVTWHRNGLLTWERIEYRAIAPPILYRLDSALAPGDSKALTAGRPGILKIRFGYAQLGGGPVRRSLLSSEVVRAAKPRIVAAGIGATPLANFEAHGVARMASIARSAIEMLATAYTADSAGGDGMTAIGRRAGHGIVAVDPRVIPLGTPLFIPGYGLAVAGDTGGAIVGHRIDLGFDSVRDAMLFGRRPVTVYRLK